MSPTIGRRLRAIPASASGAMAARAAALQAAGVEVVSFARGQPDFETPAHIREAAKRAIDRGASHYTPVAGIPELREAICAAAVRAAPGSRFTAEQVLVSVGAKQALFNLAMTLADPGDEVVIPAPCWVSYPEQVRLAGATPRIVATRSEEGFLLKPDALAAAISRRTRAVILCNPSNPTGAVYDCDTLEALAAAGREHDLWWICDEIYSRLLYDGRRHCSLLEAAPDLRDRVILVDGVSKAYAMTGWRIGWIVAPPEVVKACAALQSHSTANAAAVSQHAAVAALTGPQECVEQMRCAYEGRRDLIVGGLDGLDGFGCRPPGGAFYVFADVRGLFGRRHGETELTDDATVAAWLLEAAGCAAVPGSAYGGPGFVRFSYATSREQIARGLERIARALSELQPGPSADRSRDPVPP